MPSRPLAAKSEYRAIERLRIMAGVMAVALGVAWGVECRADAGSIPPRSEAEILKDIEASAIPNYPFKAQIDPRYRDQMKRELTGPLQRAVALYSELQKASPKYAEAARERVCIDQAELAVLGDDAALKALTDESHRPSPADSVAGATGLMMVGWWSDGDADKQKQELIQFQQFAKANAKDGILCGALLEMARYGAASDDIGNAARDIVENILTSPEEIAYKARPYKLGRPFVLRAETIDQKAISTSEWKGKVIVIDFWATWCPPCRAALPDLIKLYQENHDKGLEVLGISNDTSLIELRKFLADNKEMVWPQLFNPSPPDGWSRFSHEMEITGIPTTAFIDRNGVLRDISVGDLQPDLVAKLLAEPVKLAAAVTPENPAPTAASATSSVEPSKTESAPAAKGDAAPSEEELANTLLRGAKLMVTNERPDLAIGKLNKLIEQYPHTAAAKEAQTMLTHLNSGQ